jgi:methyl-accepting chemotaxis protein
VIEAALPDLLSFHQSNALNEIKAMVDEIRTNQKETAKHIEDMKAGQNTSSLEMTKVVDRLTNLETQVTESTRNFTTSVNLTCWS